MRLLCHSCRIWPFGISTLVVSSHWKAPWYRNDLTSCSGMLLSTLNQRLNLFYLIDWNQNICVFICCLQVLSIPLLSSYPYISKLSGLLLKFSINCASATKNILSVSEKFSWAICGVLFVRKKLVWCVKLTNSAFHYHWVAHTTKQSCGYLLISELLTFVFFCSLFVN